MNLTSTLIIATYNWPEALDLVLISVRNQKVFPSEVIIADDGSKEDTKQLVENYQKDFPVPLHHVWHEDVGFTKSIILNKAIAKASGHYIIQVDGDCIVHPQFVKDHLKFAASNVYLFGSRVTIKKEFLPILFSTKKVNFSPFSKGIKKRTRALHVPLFGKLYGTSAEFSKKYRGCNTSFFKSDFIAVNGYNEDFKGWGREDSELAIRFLNYGLSARRLRYLGIVYHIFHVEKPKDRLEINNDIEATTIAKKVKFCKNGVDKYLLN
ncbi:glycosyltransferase family 2 protein [Algibacter sp. 2305UL17-15]|uniref:glycosyltransferase family 2 protein n=1 Tax=Algibacter sp. 2305UL17-15 TaxID=3231268 RepID=UPI00345AA96F